MEGPHNSPLSRHGRQRTRAKLCSSIRFPPSAPQNLGCWRQRGRVGVGSRRLRASTQSGQAGAFEHGSWEGREVSWDLRLHTPGFVSLLCPTSCFVTPALVSSVVTWVPPLCRTGPSGMFTTAIVVIPAGPSQTRAPSAQGRLSGSTAACQWPILFPWQG